MNCRDLFSNVKHIFPSWDTACLVKRHSCVLSIIEHCLLTLWLEFRSDFILRWSLQPFLPGIALSFLIAGNASWWGFPQLPGSLWNSIFLNPSRIQRSHGVCTFSARLWATNWVLWHKPQLTYVLRSRAARSVFFNNFSPSPSRSQVHWHEAVHDAALLLPYHLLSVVTASLTSGTLDLHPLFLLKPKLTHLFQRTTFKQQFSKNNFHFLNFFSISINSTVTISFGLHL